LDLTQLGISVFSDVVVISQGKEYGRKYLYSQQEQLIISKVDFSPPAGPSNGAPSLTNSPYRWTPRYWREPQ
jgi:hypothetical protein